jgi:Arc/MetJ-type ribon-helix-helix transcriptional regulator
MLGRQPYTIQLDGAGEVQMAEVHELRPKQDSEKITINLGFVDLGHIDLLVRDGHYSNRTDFIRTAIRKQIDQHSDTARKSVVRRQLDLGISHFTRAQLEEVKAAGDMLDIRVLGLASIATDVPVELARETIRSLTVLGALHASSEIKTALSDRMS